LARQRNEGQPAVEKKPSKSESPKPSTVTEKKSPAAEPGKFKVRRKAK
jgi:hypothetical protein